MKKLLFMAVLLFASATFAQVGRISMTIDNLLKGEIVFHSFELWNRSATDSTPVENLRRSTHATLSLGALGHINESRPKTLKIAFPFKNEILEVLLYEENILTPDCQFRLPSGPYRQYKKGTYYRGMIKGDSASLAAFSFFDHEVIAIVSSPKYGDINLAKSKSGDLQDYLIYSARDQVFPKTFDCQFDDQSIEVNSRVESQKSVTETTKCVRLFYELRHEVFADQGYNLDQTLNWLTALHNNVATVYANDGINHMVLSDSFIWTTPDYFQTGSSYDYLLQFIDKRPAFNADIACLLVHSAGYGLTFGLNIGCKANHGNYTSTYGPYLVSDTNSEIADYPFYSYSVQLAAHEIGHALGSPHTHQCVWNGNGTQIDDCGNVSPFFGGPQPCYNPEAPIIPADIDGITQGNIMSYCSFNSLSAGFGPQPRQLIIDKVESQSCFGTDCIESCWPSIDQLLVSDIGVNSARLSIADLNPNANSWWVRVLPGEFELVTTNPYLLQNLPEKSAVTVEVMQTCPESLSAVYTSSFLFRTSGNYCGTEIFDYDDPTNEMTAGYPYQTTLFPDNNQQKVSLEMDYINVAQNYDRVKIYDGPNVSDPLLADFTGFDDNPGTFISTHPSGTLTIGFENNNTHWWGEGYHGYVTCVNDLGLENFADHPIEVYPNPTDRNFTVSAAFEVQSVEITDTLGRVILKKQLRQRQFEVETEDWAGGIYLVKYQGVFQKGCVRMIKK